MPVALASDLEILELFVKDPQFPLMPVAVYRVRRNGVHTFI